MSFHPQVRLVPATVPLLNALNEDRTLFCELIGSPIPDGWPEFPEAIGFTLEHLQTASEADRSWSMQLFVDHATRRLLGSGGFAAPPVERTVEIGYEVAPEFRGHGFGTAAARALVERAVGSGEVDHVIAHTLPGPNPSTGVLVSLGFEHVADQEDAEVGTVWEWRWTRPDRSRACEDLAMVIEIADFTVLPGKEEEFADAVREGLTFVSATPGFGSARLTRGIESPSRFVLLVEWESIEAHTVGFRESENFGKWRAVVGPYFDGPPRVEHVRQIL